MGSELYVFIRQSLLPKVYSLAYETHIKKIPEDRKGSQETDRYMMGFVWFRWCPPSSAFFSVWVFNKDP